MHILVTGGAGFIGSHLTEKLVQEHCKVAVLDNLYSGLKENLPKDVAFIEMDVRDSGILAVFETGRFDAVVHLAGQTMVNVSVAAPDVDADINIQGTVNVLEACRKTGVKRVVFASTAAVYGDVDELPISEESATCPTSFYGMSKLTVENYLRLYGNLYGLEYAALRFANVYGERQGDGGEGGVISIFTKLAAHGQGMKIFGDGAQTRDFIYVGDIAGGIYQALRAQAVNDIYNLSTNTEVSVNAMVKLLQEISQKDIAVTHEAPRAGDIYRSVLSNRKAVQNLHWQPQTELRDGLAKTYRYFAGQ